MKIPDYVSPIVAYRAWQWNVSGLSSLNGEPWRPARPMVARCRIDSHRATGLHSIPEKQCTCGIYATKDLEQLRSIGYAYEGVHGEVYLWGRVVEHHLGWRAQFAYPKSIVVPVELIPAGVKQADALLEPLVTYGVDIFLEDVNGKADLWTKETGYQLPRLTQFMRKAVAGGSTVPIAVLTEDPPRHVLLQNGMEVKHASKIVFTDLRLKLNTSKDPLISQFISNTLAKVVVVDLTLENARLVKRAIDEIRAARSGVGVFVRFDQRDPQILNSNMLVVADAYLHRDGEDDVQIAFDGFRRRRARQQQPPWGGSTPPGGVTPPSLPPPPAVPVHSSWDISRIIQCARYNWPHYWHLEEPRV